MSTKSILLLGSGFVAAPCLNYLLRRPENKVTVAARRVAIVEDLVAGKPNAKAIALDVSDEAALEAEIAKHDLVISLIPYTHHARVIKAAVKHRRHVVTTSYVSPAMMEFDQAAKDAGVIVMNEIGVDPGIDHLYAVKIIEEVHAAGGKITSFTSYCGGLPAPECSNNPLGYKFSWSSRGVLLALRNNAKFIQDGKVVEIPGAELMNSAKPIPIYPAFAFEGYPNRDSTPYDKRYNIPESKTIIRGTLRYKGFPTFINALVKLGFLNDAEVPHLAAGAKAIPWRALLEQSLGTSNLSDEALVDAVKARTGLKGDEADQVIFGMKWLGMFSEKPVTLRGTMLDCLCATLEEKMMYGPDERDMVMLQHRFEVETAAGKKEIRTSTGLWFGVPGGDSAMATTVGVPCGIATQLILDGVIKRPGVLAPMDMELVAPLLEKLEAEGIKMVDEIIQ
ncbi:saccharopine dehydrogenase (NADP+, L-glutamate-forming) [Blyttiomyces sp. JEL0837]|nr:saccharopine dehydrogenase (NADP+, L-glutamate-forming) [Blyttiomyces sp. JEL0837]